MSIGLFFLSSVVAHGSATTLRHVNEDFFVDDDEIRAYDYVRRHLEQYGEVASADAVFETTGVNLPDVTDDIEYHRTRLFDRKFHNDVRESYNGLRDALADGEANAAREAIQELAAIAIRDRPQRDLLDVGAAGEAMMTQYQRNHRNPGVTGITTGWGSLDRDTGGYQPADLIAWVARMGIGKTWLLLWMMRAAYDAGSSVLFVSTEMPVEQIMARYFAMVAGIDARLIRQGRLGNRAENRLREVVDEYAENARRFHVYMGKTTTGVASVVAELQPDILYLDGAYLLRSPNASRNADRNGRVAHVVDDLKDLAMTRGIPIICTTQFNRQGANRKASALETVGFTDAWGQNSSLVYAIRRAHSRATNQDSLIITTEKGREGESAEMAISFRFRPVDFSEIDINEARGPREQAEADAPNLNWMT